MEEKLNQLWKNNTWRLIHKSKIEPSLWILGGKWVYKIKRDINGNIARFKTRSVIKGYLPQFKIDFNQTFAAVIKSMAFRVFFSIEAFFNLNIDKIDVKTAFLYDLID